MGLRRSPCGLRKAAFAVVLGALLPPLLLPSLQGPLRAQNTIAPAPAPAPGPAPAPASAYDGLRALNLARNTAVMTNGGLSLYRPAACMFSTDAAAASGCLVRRDAQGFLFRFLGGPPGWERLNLPPSVETEIQISADGRSVVNQSYTRLNQTTNPPLP